jgi:2-keto-4-pentenoate hydratase
MDLQTIANEIKAAQDQCRPIVPLTSRFADFSNGEAYSVAGLIHEMRIKEGAIPVGRKIGFTNPEM